MSVVNLDIKVKKLPNGGTQITYTSSEGDVTDIYFDRHNRMHRVDGPALITYLPKGNKHFYYVGGVEYSEEAYSKLLKDVEIGERETFTDLVEGFE